MEDHRRRTYPKGFNPDAWRVRREFLRISDPLPPPPFKDGEPVSDAVSRVVKALGVPAADSDALGIVRDWAEIVGPDIAKHATPGDLSNGTLTIRVKGSVWFAELRRSAPRLLLPKLQARFASVKAVLVILAR